MATIAQLKTAAVDLGLSPKSKSTKKELEAMINAKREELADQRAAEFVTANSKPIPAFIAIQQGLMRPKAPRNVPLTLPQRVENYGGAIIDGKPKNLTAAQRRRLNKKLAKHGE